jgi:hypothetical protein
MIASDIITRVRRTFGDEAAVQVTDDDVIRWINDAQVEVVKHNEGALQKSAFVNLVANQSTYVLPTDLLLLRALRYKFTDMQSYSRLRYQSMQEFDEVVDGWDGTLYGTGSPLYFTMDEGKAILFPTPNQASTSGLKVLYNQKPTDVVLTSDALSLPLIYHNTIVTYCMWQASLLDEDHEPAMMYKSAFTDDTNLLITRETTEATSTYKTITIMDDDL